MAAPAHSQSSGAHRCRPDMSGSGRAPRGSSQDRDELVPRQRPLAGVAARPSAERRRQPTRRDNTGEGAERAAEECGEGRDQHSHHVTA